MVRVEGIENIAFTCDGGVRLFLRECQKPDRQGGQRSPYWRTGNAPIQSAVAASL